MSAVTNKASKFSVAVGAHDFISRLFTWWNLLTTRTASAASVIGFVVIWLVASFAVITAYKCRSQAGYDIVVVTVVY